MKFENGLLVVGVLLMASLVTTPCLASAVEVVFETPNGLVLSSTSVTVVKAEPVNDEGSLRITGQLKRPHRLPMAGHLHAFTYTVDNDLITDSRHRVLSLNSQRKGLMRVPFNILLENNTGASKVRLEFHNPGHQES
ncbi:MAG: hypothetical protein RQ722_04060 [Desulfuromonadales bacterium]|nr:hypothetical protein [Desulfuromonadales bacterium]